MALSLEELLLVATDLTLALALSSLLYAVGCLGFAGLLGYGIILSSGVLQNAKRNIRQKKNAVVRKMGEKKEAVMSTVLKSCFGRKAAEILDLASFIIEALSPSEWAPTLKEECPSSLDDQQLPAGEKKCQEAPKTPNGSRLYRTGMSYGTKKQLGRRWEEERDDLYVPMKQKKIFRIPAFLLPLLFAPLNWCLNKRFFHKLITRLTTLIEPRP